MKIRLHKGPAHGKLYHVPDGQISIQVATLPKARQSFYSAGAFGPTATIERRSSTYQQVFINIPVGNEGFNTIPSVGPDGAFYFQYRP